MSTERPFRHPITGRFMAGDCERDCLEHCAGLCGVTASNAEAFRTLFADEVVALPHGAEVEIVWSGGNGPHRYRVHHACGDTYAVPFRSFDAGPDDPMWFYNPITCIGNAPPFTVVSASPAVDPSPSAGG